MAHSSRPDAAADKDQFSVAPPAVALPKGGGAIRGIGEKFSANPVTGTGSLAVPISLSPGRGGFGPQLAITYDSGAGNGPFGLGWQLSLPAITRKTDRGLPTYLDAAESDVFILAGSEDLVPLLIETESGWQRAIELGRIGTVEYRIFAYRPRIEGRFARIERWHADGRETFWRTISRDNVTTSYGQTPDSRIVDPADATRIFGWLICETYDDKGHVARYEYQREDRANVDRTQAHERNRGNAPPTANVYIKRITYGNTPSRLHPEYQDPSKRTWLFEAVFDYDEAHYNEAPPDADGRVFAQASSQPPANARWRVRNDPFSSCRSGFDVRTYRLCRRVLMFHRFAELGREPVLVKSTDFDYAPGASATFLKSVTHSSYAVMGGQLLKRSLPPVAFVYSPSPSVQDLSARRVEEVAGESLENLPVGLGGPGYQWVDLDGEGLSGVLSEQSGAWHYKRNLGNGRFGPIEAVAARPSVAERGTHQLMDLAGDGHLDVVVSDAQLAGIAERTSTDGWDAFRPFASAPNVSWRDPSVRFLDLTGDGHADLMVSEHEAFVWHQSLGERGFGPAQSVARLLDEETGPHLTFADGTQTIFLADMNGDGLIDLLRIRSGEVCYWPNLGYGRFGARVTMDDAPWFDHPDRFDPSRIRLSDVDGSGLTDIVYLHADAPVLYFNQSGNSWSDGRLLPQFPRVDDLSTVQVVDLLGTGTACLVWSSPLAADAARPLRYLDLMGGVKPHLLVQVDNNLGARTSLEYAASTRFYLDDRAAGRPWITRLPFPVHVVTRTTVDDTWRRTRFSSTYSYHHGYFDGEEREFRGFGRVEQTDVEDYGPFAEGNIASPFITQDQTLYQPPIKTVTWYQTGAALDRRRILTQFATEYFPARHPQQAFPEKVLPEPGLDPDLTAEEWREALRACKGMVLRQEVYELDVEALHGKASTDVPVRLFSAATHNCQIRRLQPRGDYRHAAFLVTESEALSYQYELDLRTTPIEPDPRVTQTLNLRHDEYGNPQQSVVVAYGRVAPGQHASLPRADLIDQVQAETHIAYSETRYTKDVVLPEPIAGLRGPIEHHRLRLPCEVLSYELAGIAPSAGPYYELSDFRRLDLSEQYGHEDSSSVPLLPVARKGYHEQVNGAVAQKRIVEHARSLFFDDESAVLPPTVARAFGLHGPRGLKFEDYKLALTNELLDAVFQQRDPQAGGVLDDKLTWEINSGVAAREKLDQPITSGSPNLESGYILGVGIDASLTGQYWMRSGIAGFAVDAVHHFYLPERYTDAFGNITTLQFDSRDLFIQSSRDALGNTSGVVIDAATGAARFDYRVLAPIEIVDPNGNHSEVRFDVLGLVVAAAVKGKPVNGVWEGDHLDDFTEALVNPPAAQVVTFCTRNTLDSQRARSWLAGASTRFVYHFGDDNGRWSERMAGACAIVREEHAGQLAAGVESPLQVSLECSDGTGNVLMKKVQAEPDPDSTAADPPLRWIVNGLTVLNNKGKPVKQYEPAFSPVGFGCERPQANGVTTVIYYDAAGRPVRTELPDGTFSRVEFSPWQVTTYDQNDTALDSAWYAERDAATAAPAEEKRAALQAEKCADTPAVTILDSLGREVIAIAHNRVPDDDVSLANTPLLNRPWLDERYVTVTKLDAEGKPLWIRDARGHMVMQFISPPRANSDQGEGMPPGAVPCYDIAGHPLFQHSMDAGDRWMLMDAAGKSLLAWDVNVRNRDDGTTTAERRLFHSRYDALRRPLEQWLNVNTAPAVLIEAFAYVDTNSFKSTTGVVDQAGLTAARGRNLIGQATRHYDTSGLATIEHVDFKGAAEEITRTLVSDVKAAVIDWNVPDRGSLLDGETFRHIEQRDALGRLTTLYNWHRGVGTRVAVYEPRYNERGTLASEEIVVGTDKTAGSYDRTVGIRTPAIQRIRYNAKGQKTSLALGNGTTTRYTYDAKTFRLAHLYTRREPRFTTDCAGDPDAERPARPCGVQNLHYTYDPVGNISHIQDDAQQTIWFANQQVEPSNEYLYDALERLIEATGRENAAAVGAPPHPGGHWPTGMSPSAASTRRYTQRFRYDAVGNLATMRHIAPGFPGQPDGSWTRTYAYAFEDPAQPASNRLWQTWQANDRTQAVTYRHDPHGSMLNLDQTAPGQDLRWDWRDLIRALDLQGGGNAFYNYGIDKQRTRKRLVRNDGSTEDRVYLGGYELYRRRSPQGAVIEEIESLHLVDGTQRMLLVDDVLVAASQPGSSALNVRKQMLFRYQYGNHLGSVGTELDAAAQVISHEEFHPYGTTAYRLMNSAAEAPAKRYRYAGREMDEESGWSHHGARYYLPGLARWVSTDPLGIKDGLNLFAFVRGNPIVNTDPTGTQSQYYTPDSSQLRSLLNQMQAGTDALDVEFGVRQSYGTTQLDLVRGGRGSLPPRGTGAILAHGHAPSVDPFSGPSVRHRADLDVLRAQVGEYKGGGPRQHAIYSPNDRSLINLSRSGDQARVVTFKPDGKVLVEQLGHAPDPAHPLGGVTDWRGTGAKQVGRVRAAFERVKAVLSSTLGDFAAQSGGGRGTAILSFARRGLELGAKGALAGLSILGAAAGGVQVGGGVNKMIEGKAAEGAIDVGEGSVNLGLSIGTAIAAKSGALVVEGGIAAGSLGVAAGVAAGVSVGIAAETARAGIKGEQTPIDVMDKAYGTGFGDTHRWFQQASWVPDTLKQADRSIDDLKANLYHRVFN